MQERHERFDAATQSLCGAGTLPGACLAGVVTLLLGGVCWADAFIVPGLFGPVAAAVVAAERLLCATRTSSTRAAALWTCIAFGWIAVASCMLHAPSLSASLLQWLVVLLVVSSAACRLWSRLASAAPNSERISIWFVAVGVIAQLATLFGTTAAPLARVAAAVAIELVLIGIVRLLSVPWPRRGVRDSLAYAASPFDATANARARMVNIETGIA